MKDIFEVLDVIRKRTSDVSVTFNYKGTSFSITIVIFIEKGCGFSHTFDVIDPLGSKNEIYERIVEEHRKFCEGHIVPRLMRARDDGFLRAKGLTEDAKEAEVEAGNIQDTIDSLFGRRSKK